MKISHDGSPIKSFLVLSCISAASGIVSVGKNALYVWNAALAALMVPELGWSAAFPFLVVDTLHGW